MSQNQLKMIHTYRAIFAQFVLSHLSMKKMKSCYFVLGSGSYDKNLTESTAMLSSSLNELSS